MIKAAVANETRRQLVAQRMQIKNVGSGIFELRRGKRLRCPVRRLLRLGNIDLQHFLEVVLQPVPVRIGAGQP